MPLALAAAINLEPGEEIQWQLRSRNELNLVRNQKKQNANPDFKQEVFQRNRKTSPDSFPGVELLRDAGNMLKVF